MKLMVSEEKSDDRTIFCIKPEYLKQKGTLLYLASNPWEEAIIEVSKLPIEEISLLCRMVKNINVKLPEVVTIEDIKKLAIIYPHMGGKLRSCFLQKGDINELLLSMREHGNET